MSNYIPLSSFEGQPTLHEAPPARRDPWFVWVIALAPVPPLITLMAVGSTSYLESVLAIVAIVLATTATCVWLARRDPGANPWLAVAPAAYLLVRASRRAAGPHRGNPLWPLMLNLVLGFAAGYYVVLFLAAIVQIVNLAA